MRRRRVRGRLPPAARIGASSTEGTGIPSRDLLRPDRSAALRTCARRGGGRGRGARGRLVVAPLVARILWLRGHRDPAAAAAFLSPKAVAPGVAVRAAGHGRGVGADRAGRDRRRADRGLRRLRRGRDDGDRAAGAVPAARGRERDVRDPGPRGGRVRVVGGDGGAAGGGRRDAARDGGQRRDRARGARARGGARDGGGGDGPPPAGADVAAGGGDRGPDADGPAEGRAARRCAGAGSRSSWRGAWRRR